jgi:AraC-like DNA-binding protein
MSTNRSHSRAPRPHKVGDARFARSGAFGGFMSLDGSSFETHLPPHVHSSYVIGVVEDGAVRVTTNGQSHVATAGMVVAIAPFAVHTELPIANGGWSFRYLYPSETVVRAALGVPVVGGPPALAFVRPVIDDPALADAVRALQQRIANGDRVAAAEELLVSTLRRVRERHGRGVRSSRAVRGSRATIREIRDFICERPQRGVTLSHLAEAARLSEFHFTRLFRAEVGLPPYTYYEQVRVAFAHELIQRGRDLPSVAFELGYADQSHLTRHFHRGSFTTPGRLAALSRDAISRSAGR